MARTFRKKTDFTPQYIYRLDCWDHSEYPVDKSKKSDRLKIEQRTTRRDGRKEKQYKCICNFCINTKRKWKERKAENPKNFEIDT